MSKVFTVNDGESECNQLPSIEYINELVKMIEDKLVYPDTNFDGFPAIKATKEVLPVGVKEIPVVLAKDIETDYQHRFINEALIDTMLAKPTRFEMEQAVSNAKIDMQSYMDNVYMRIINTPNIINKLRDIATILNEDEVANGLLNTLSYKLNIDDFKEHTDSQFHLNNNDRKAINILLKSVMTGFADWDAKDGACNEIKNKPKSLPANGGNADTIANHGIKDLINKYDYNLVIGSSSEKYSKDSCDIYAEDGVLNYNELNNAINWKSSGIILFKRGHYNIDHMDAIFGATMIFNGVDYRLSSITVNNYIRMNNVVFNNIGFDRSKIYINSSCELRNVKFSNCEIILDGAEECTITDCVFDKCTIKVQGDIMNSIIKFNRYILTKPIQFIGGNNIITDNI